MSNYSYHKSFLGAHPFAVFKTEMKMLALCMHEGLDSVSFSNRLFNICLI